MDTRTLTISDAFPFSVGDLEDVPDHLLRKFMFMDNDVESKEDVEICKILIGKVTRDLAITTCYQKGSVPAGTVKALAKLSADTSQRQWNAFELLFAAQKKKKTDDGLNPVDHPSGVFKTLQWCCWMLRQRSFNIEMAIHEWHNWSKKTEDDILWTLHEYKRCGLNAVEILSEGPGYSQNPGHIAFVAPGSNFTARFRIYNPGPTTWPPGCHGKWVIEAGKEDDLRFKDRQGEQFTSIIPHSVEAGKDVVLEFILQPRPEQVHESNGSECHSTEWTMITPGGIRFGSPFYFEYTTVDGSRAKFSERRPNPTKEEASVSTTDIQVGKWTARPHWEHINAPLWPRQPHWDAFGL